MFVGVFVMSKHHEIRKFVETYGITYPVGKENGIARILDVPAMPATVFINRDGKIIRKHLDEINYDGIISGIEAILR
jgi:hypothetical protein